jgi:hypothetical protein
MGSGSWTFMVPVGELHLDEAVARSYGRSLGGNFG